MNSFIELTSPNEGRNFVVNISQIISITPTLPSFDAKSFILLSCSSVLAMESVTEILSLIHATKTQNTSRTEDGTYGPGLYTTIPPIKEPYPCTTGGPKWLPIHSAPRDGSLVLVFIPTYSRPTWASFHNGVWTEDDDCLHEVSPTHWILLPCPP